MTLQSQAKLIIVCGLPGSGKTTHAKMLEKKLAGFRMCPDEWMEYLALNIYDESSRSKVESLQWNFTQKLLKYGQVIIIEWGTWRQSEREILRTGSQKLGATVELHYLSASIDFLYERIRNRDRENPAITYEQISDWSGLFQIPTSEEMSRYDYSSHIEIK